MATWTVKQGGGAQFTTIQGAVAAAAANDTVLIQDSATYTGYVDLTSYLGGGFCKIVHFEADAGCSPVWDGTGAGSHPCINASTFAPGFVQGLALSIKGIRFTNWNYNAGYGSGVIFLGGKHIAQLERCTFVDCNSTAVNYGRGDAGTHGRFDRCTFRNCDVPIFLDGGMAPANRYIDFVNCDIYPKSQASGITAYYAESTVYHCTVVTRSGVGTTGIEAGTVVNSVVRGTSGNGNFGIRAVNSVSYCDVSGTWATPYQGTQGASCLHVAPGFVNEVGLDFRLGDTSALKNAGTDVGVTIDRDGNTRPAGAGYDIGAYERIAAVTGATALTSTTVRVDFDSAVAVTPELTDPSSYVLAQVEPAAGVVPTVATVEPEAGGAPTYVTLTTSEHTDGQTYSVTVSGVPGLSGMAEFVGIGVAPTVLGVEVLAPDLLRVRFSEPMLEDAALTSPSSYGFIALPGSPDPDVPFVVSVTPEPGGAPTYVDIAIGGGRRNTHYTFRVKA